MHYILTVKYTCLETYKETTINLATDLSPELWLAKAYLKLTKYDVLLLNSIYVEKPNKLAMERINDRTYCLSFN